MRKTVLGRRDGEAQEGKSELVWSGELKEDLCADVRESGGTGTR